jgi:nucleoside-diphosphate-sugar epimerase
MAKILLLGGTGAIGSYVRDFCLKDGHQIFISSRSNRISNNKNITYIKGNGKCIDFLKSTLLNHSFDAIIDFMNYNTTQFSERIDILTNQTKHYIFLSSYRVYDNNGNIPLKEDSPRLLNNCKDTAYLKTEEYALSKARQEDLLKFHKNRNWTILRPSITYSTDRFQLCTLEANTLLPRINRKIPIILPIDILDKKTTLTWGGDVGYMISKLLLKDISYSETYNIANNEAIKWKEVANIYKEVFGLKIRYVDLKTYSTLGLNPYQLMYDRLFDRVCDNSKIINHTETQSYKWKSAKEGIYFEFNKTDTSKWNNSYTRIHGRMDRILGIKRFKEILRCQSKLNYFVGYFKVTNIIYFITTKIDHLPFFTIQN